MNTKRIIIRFFTVMLMIYNGQSIGQSNSESPVIIKQNVSLSMEPFFLFNGALKLNAEYMPTNKSYSFVLTPEVYFGDINNDSGFGIGLMHKIRLNKKPNSAYFGYGLTYRNNKISYHETGWLPYQEDGSDFYKYGEGDFTSKINSVLFSSIMGFQQVYYNHFLIDAYCGLGYKTSNKYSDNGPGLSYDENWFKHAYKGPLVLLGLKVGYSF